MAEVLGLVASGISVAQVAGSLVTASLKLKALLDEVKNAPENLRDMLDQLELLTPILCEATANSDDVAGTSPSLSAHSHVQQALQKALGACQTASEQLELLAADLMSQINNARGGVRRKHAKVKVVLKKGTLAQHEIRLQKTIQLLTLAQNTYIIAVQRTQPEAIVSELMSALARPPQDALTHAKISQDQRCPSVVTTKHTNRRILAQRPPIKLGKSVQMGFAQVTGLVRIHTQSQDENTQTTAASHGRFMRIQIQTPVWLCASVLDAAFSRSYAGWNCSLNVYGKLVDGSVGYDLASDAIDKDDIDSIRGLFQERRCGPLDRFASRDGHQGFSLLQYAMIKGAWKVSTYLLDYDAECGEYFPSSRFKITSAEVKTSFESFLMHDELSDTVRMSCLAYYSEGLNYFTDLVGRLWPLNEFYDRGLHDQRLDAALVQLKYFVRTAHSPSSTIFLHLCGSLPLPEAGRSTTMKILSYLALGIGQIVWQDPDFSRKWQSAFLSIALRLNKAFMMPAQQASGGESFDFGWTSFLSVATPFTNLFLPSFRALPGFSPDRKKTRPHRVKGRLSNCARAVQIWLSILSECGVDLLEYGKRVKQWLDDQQSGCYFRIFRDVWWNDEDETMNGLFEIRLISFKYGSQPGDWEMWWSEPTDKLVGDFWREVEPEERTFYIPGSWVGD